MVGECALPSHFVRSSHPSSPHLSQYHPTWSKRQSSSHFKAALQLWPGEPAHPGRAVRFSFSTRGRNSWSGRLTSGWNILPIADPEGMTPWLGNDTAGDRTPDLRMTSAARDHLAMMSSLPVKFESELCRFALPLKCFGNRQLCYRLADVL